MLASGPKMGTMETTNNAPAPSTYRFAIDKSATSANNCCTYRVFSGDVEIGLVWHSARGWVAASGTCTTYKIPTRETAAAVLQNARTMPRYTRGDIVVINAPKHAAHGMRARVTKRIPRTVGQPGDVYEVRLLSAVSDDANPRPIPRALYRFDTEELSLAPGCEECNFRGWVEMGDEHDDEIRKIERCDTCGVFATDDDALTAARAAGWTPDGCLSCWSQKCGLCGFCHTCIETEARAECSLDEVQ